MGYSARHLKLLDRLVYVVTGLFLFFPTDAFIARPWINLAGVCMAVAVFLRERAVRGGAMTVVSR